MFTKTRLLTDSQLSPSEIANLLVEDALNKMSQLTGLDSQKCFQLISAQVTKDTDQESASTPNRFIKKTPVLDQGEVQFINQLFHYKHPTSRRMS